jgi:hypothetical protein
MTFAGKPISILNELNLNSSHKLARNNDRIIATGESVNYFSVWSH